MNLKIIFSFLFITCALTQAKSQNCAISDKVDPFNHQRIVETSDVKLYGSDLLSYENISYFMSFVLKNDKFFICINSRLGSSVNTAPTEFDNVILLLSDNSTINLNDFQSNGSDLVALDLVNKSYSKVSRSIVNRLINLKVTMVRFSKTGSGTPIDAAIKSGKGNDISKFAKCILSYQSEEGAKAESEWIIYKIDDKLSIKLPTQPEQVNDVFVRALDEDNSTYMVGIVVPKTAVSEYLSTVKSNWTKQGFQLGDFIQGTWKTYTCYHLEGTFTNNGAKLNTYCFAVVLDSRLYLLFALVPDGKGKEKKDDFFTSLAMN